MSKLYGTIGFVGNNAAFFWKGDPVGPFDTEAEALAAAREGA